MARQQSPPSDKSYDFSFLLAARAVISLSSSKKITNAEKTNFTETMILTNIESIPGKTIVEHYGLVQGSTIRAKHVGRDLMAGLKNIVGGELKGYTELMKEARQQASDRMVEQAQEMGADAIINIRFTTTSVSQGAAEMLAYGTAVRFG